MGWDAQINDVTRSINRVTITDVDTLNEMYKILCIKSDVKNKMYVT